MPVNINALRKELVYETEASPAQIRADVDRIRVMDKVQERKESRWSFGCAGFLVAAVGAFVWAAATDGGVTAAWFALGGCVAVAIFCGIMSSLAGAANADDKRYELLQAVLGLLEVDVRPEVPVSVRLDLRKPNDKSKYTESGEVRGWNVKYFVDPWLQMRGKLADGTSFKVVVTERFQERTRWKRSRSGKMKRKSKTKSATRFDVQLKPKTKRYKKLDELGESARGAVQLPPSVALKGMAIEEGGVVLKAITKAPWDIPTPEEPVEGQDGAQIVAMMLLSLYQVLNLSRALTKEQKKRAG